MEIDKAVEDKSDKYSDSANKMRGLYKRFKERKQGKEIRKQLRALPYQCRHSYIKILLLKSDTSRLQFDMNLRLKPVATGGIESMARTSFSQGFNMPASFAKK